MTAKSGPHMRPENLNVSAVRTAVMNRRSLDSGHKEDAADILKAATAQTIAQNQIDIVAIV